MTSTAVRVIELVLITSCLPIFSEMVDNNIRPRSNIKHLSLVEVMKLKKCLTCNNGSLLHSRLFMQRVNEITLLGI